MWSFLERHFRYPNEVFPQLGKDAYCRLARNDQSDAETSGMSYCNHTKAIGFDYNAAGLEQRMIYMTVCWIAQRSKVRKRWQNLSLPVCCYDGAESLVLVTEEEVETHRDKLIHSSGWMRSDSDGWHLPSGEELLRRTIVVDYLHIVNWDPNVPVNDSDAVTVSSFGQKVSREMWNKADSLLREDYENMRTELKRLSALWESESH